MDLLFNRASSLVRQGKRQILQIVDLLPLPAEMDPRQSSLNEHVLVWTLKKDFILSLMKSARGKLIAGLLLFLASGSFALLSPILVHDFVQILGTKLTEDSNLFRALLLALGLGFCGLTRGLLLQHYFYLSLALSQNVVNLLNRKIFFHSLKLSPESRQKIPVGDIVNFMSSDSDAVADFMMMVCELAHTFLLIVGVVVLLFYYIGVSAVPALVILFGIAPLTRKVARSFVTLDEQMMAQRDRRVTLMAQILNAIRTVKFFSWERSVRAEVGAVRDLELQARRKMAQAEVYSNMAYTSVSAIVLLVALVTIHLRGQSLQPDIVFTCVSLFTLLAEPFGELSRLISRLSAGMVGADRICQFLNQAQVAEANILHSHDDRALVFRDVSFRYLEKNKNQLSQINFSLRRGESLAVVGPVGAGKSTLLQLVLQEMKPTEGELQKFIRDQAYVPQEAFIINGSLRENLSFGNSQITDSEIQEALAASCLDQDMKLWPSGLNTEIGEKGVNLSGGQKQRVGLARAYLSRADLLLLDDPLSAVDSETETRLCDRLLFGAWKEKTLVVVTHRLQNLSRFTHILFLQESEPPFVGTWERLRGHPRFLEFYSNHELTHQNMNLEADVHAPTAMPPGPDAVNEEPPALDDLSHRITADEEREVGAVKKSIYFDYISALGGRGSTRRWILLGLFGGAMAVSSMPLLQRGWLSQMQGTTADLWVYGGLALLTIFVELSNSLFWLDRGIKAGQAMHDDMLESVLAAKIRFFDSTPVGRIIQRFSRDVESVDIYLQWTFDTAIHCLLFVLVSLALILSVVPLSALFMIPVLYFYYTVQRDYRRPAREAKRMDSIARSPRYAHFKETLMGLTVIRAFNKQKWFQEQFYDKLAHSQRMFYNHYMLNRWFSTRIPLIGGFIAAGTGLVMVWMAREGHLSAGLAGLVTVYSLSFWGYLNWGIRIFADLESRMTSVERLKSYAQIPAEVEGSEIVPSSWPSHGDLRFERVYARYAETLPFVLQGVSFEIPAGARVGLVGRTGSGKSTLFQTLYRLVDIESGDIFIDDISIKNIPLARLRRSLAIIPQDPTLFMGTLRSNLDRYHESSDAEIWEALRQSGLENLVRSLSGGLEFQLNENGVNLSQGQRQLICLARALLRRAKIIVLDEATASVDVETDVLLQNVLRHSLQGVTLLIIAHRLGTVRDCDLVVELSQGRVLQVLTAEDLERQKNRLKDVIA